MHMNWKLFFLCFLFVSANVVEAKDPRQKIDLWKGPTQLRGVNIHQSLVMELDGGTKGTGAMGSPFNLQDFKEMAALGANYVNISHAGPSSEKAPFLVDERVLKNLDHLLAMIQQADMFAVISIRSGPGRSELTFVFGQDNASDPVNGWFPPSMYNDTVWTDKTARDAWIEMWRTLARRYKDNPIVVGYDLMVEPNANEIFFKIYDGKSFYQKYRGTGYDWNSWYPTLVAAIREVDKKTPVLVQPMGYGRADWLPFLQASQDSKIVYAIHQYEPFAYTHQQNTRLRYPNVLEKVDRSTLEGICTQVDKFLSTVKGGMAAVNEYGLHRDNPGAELYLADMLALFEKRGWNHALWAWYPAHFIKHRPPIETSFDLRFGANVKNVKPVANPLQDAVLKYWKLNRARPSNTRY